MKRKMPITCLLMTCACLILLSGVTLAQEKTVAAGNMACSIVERKDFSLSDVVGHGLTLNQSTGDNKTTPAGGFMDAASVVNYSVGDLVKGSGSQFGYVMFAKGPDTTYARWQHQVTTVVGSDGKPKTSFKGNFNFTGGTGKYKGIAGSGIFTGEFSTPTAYNVAWQGEYTIRK